MTEQTAPLDVRQLTGDADDGRSRLVNAALACFAEKGFHGTSTRDIAAAAGMSPAAVYVHYRTKQELLYAIARAGHEQILRLVADSVDTAGDPATRLGDLVGRFVASHARWHTTARIVNYELRALNPEQYAAIAAIRRTTVGRVRGLLQEGVEAGVFTTPDPQLTALAVLSLGIDAARWYRTGGDWSPEQVADHYRELVLRMAGAPQR